MSVFVLGPFLKTLTFNKLHLFVGQMFFVGILFSSPLKEKGVLWFQIVIGARIRICKD